MSRYRIQLLNADGSVRREQVAEYAHDDDAIDHAGDIDHPEAISVWQGARLVAQFPPWRGARQAAWH